MMNKEEKEQKKSGNINSYATKYVTEKRKCENCKNDTISDWVFWRWNEAI